MLKKDLIIAVLLTFCLSTMLFRVLPTSSQSAGDYDPWYDVNDDGTIDMKDVGGVARKFGASGTAINKTDLLLELLDRVDSIEEKLSNTETIRFFEPNETMNNQETWKDGAVFFWIPDNVSDNAIIAFRFYFDYQCNSEGLQVRIFVEDQPAGASSVIGPFANPVYKSSYVYSFDLGRDLAYYVGINLEPNMNNYTIRFQFRPNSHLYPAYVKNINIIIEVIDGIPSN